MQWNRRCSRPVEADRGSGLGLLGLGARLGGLIGRGTCSSGHYVRG